MPPWIHPRRERFLLALVLLLAAALRLHALGRESPWTDELMTLQQSTAQRVESLPYGAPFVIQDRTRLEGARPLRDLPRSLARDTHPPGYYALVRWWRQAWAGDDVTRVRLLSALFSLATVALCYATARALAGPGAGLLAGLLCALSPTQVLFAQEARPYATAAAAVALAAASAARLRARGGGDRLALFGLAAAVALAPGCHYFAGVAVAGPALYALAFAPQRRRTLQAVAAGVVVFGLACGSTLGLQLSEFRGVPKMHKSWFGDALRFEGNLAWRVASAPARVYASTELRAVAQPFRELRPLVALSVLLLPLLAAPLLVPRGERLRVALPWLWLAAGLGAAVVSELRGTAALGVLRFTSFSGPAVAVLIALLSDRWRWRAVTSGATLLAATLLVSGAWSPGRPDYRSFAEYVALRAGTDGGVMMVMGRGMEPFRAEALHNAVNHFAPSPTRKALFSQGEPRGWALAPLAPHGSLVVVGPLRQALPQLPGFRLAEQLEMRRLSVQVGWYRRASGDR